MILKTGTKLNGTQVKKLIEKYGVNFALFFDFPGTITNDMKFIVQIEGTHSIYLTYDDGDSVAQIKLKNLKPRALPGGYVIAKADIE